MGEYSHCDTYILVPLLDPAPSGHNTILTYLAPAVALILYLSYPSTTQVGEKLT